MYKISTDNIGDVKKYVWHYRKDNKDYGPFTYEDIVDKVKTGEIGPDDYVLKFGNRKFVKISEVQGLVDLSVQIEEEQEEPELIPQEQQPEANKEKESEAKAEEVKDDFRMIYENRPAHAQRKRKNEFPGQKIALIAAGIAGLGLVAWLLIRLL
jgi:hypothetical protein